MTDAPVVTLDVLRTPAQVAAHWPYLVEAARSLGQAGGNGPYSAEHLVEAIAVSAAVGDPTVFPVVATVAETPKFFLFATCRFPDHPAAYVSIEAITAEPGWYAPLYRPVWRAIEHWGRGLGATTAVCFVSNERPGRERVFRGNGFRPIGTVLEAPLKEA